VTQAVLAAIQGPASGAAAAPDLDAPLATLGIDSVQTVELLAELEDDLGVVLQMNELVQRSTLRGLIDAIDAELDRPPHKAPPRAGA
jgi:acyl carrier protein